MAGRIWLLIALVMVGMTGCDRVKTYNVPTDDPNWGLGHVQGLKEGIEQGRADVCEEIKKYNNSMAYDLNENTQICGWGAGREPAQKTLNISRAT